MHAVNNDIEALQQARSPMQIHILAPASAAPTARIVRSRTRFDQRVEFTSDLILDNDFCGFKSSSRQRLPAVGLIVTFVCDVF